MKNEENNMGKELESSVENRVRGWHMTPDETKSFFKGLGKKVITFVGYSSGYEDEKEMLRTVKNRVIGVFSQIMDRKHRSNNRRDRWCLSNSKIYGIYDNRNSFNFGD